MTKQAIKKSGLQARKAEAAKLTGLDTEKIGTINFQLSKLRELGLLVDIDVSGLSMFTTAATWRELGIADEDERKNRLHAGSKTLISDRLLKELRSCESSYRQLLDKYSYDVTGFRPFRWMPFKVYQQWRRDAKSMEDRFNAIKARIMRERDAEIDALAADEEQIARRAWKSATAQGYVAVRFGGQTYTSEDTFIDSVMSAATSRFPSQARIENDLRLEYRTAILQDGADVEAELLAEERANQKRNDTRRAEWLKDERARAEIEAIKQAELEHQRRVLAETRQPIDEIVSDMRGRVLDIARGMLESVNKNGFLRGKVAEQGSGLLEFFQLMTLGADRDLESALADLKTKIGPVGADRADKAPERDVDQIKAALENILTVAQDEAENMMATGRFASLEL